MREQLKPTQPCYGMLLLSILKSLSKQGRAIVFCPATVLFLLLVVGCEQDPDPCPKTETLRVASPDGQVEAVLVARDCGSFTTQEHLVFLARVGDKNLGHGLVFRADHATGLALSWPDDKLLEITYQKARIFRFTNIWRSEAIQGSPVYVVEIKETLLNSPRALSPEARGESGSLAGDGVKR